MKIRRGDNVVILTGSDRGKTGTVEQVLPGLGRVVVGGVNVRTKHHKKTSSRSTAGVEKISLPIDVSNVGLIKPGSKSQPSRVGFEHKSDGKKVRIFKSGGKVVGNTGKTKRGSK